VVVVAFSLLLLNCKIQFCKFCSSCDTQIEVWKSATNLAILTVTIHELTFCNSNLLDYSNSRIIFNYNYWYNGSIPITNCNKIDPNLASRSELSPSFHNFMFIGNMAEKKLSEVYRVVTEEISSLEVLYKILPDNIIQVISGRSYPRTFLYQGIFFIILGTRCISYKNNGIAPSFSLCPQHCGNNP